MGLFLTADHHFGHARILDYTDRPWPDVDTMNDALVDLWNDTVTPGDTVWVLGDFALGRRAETLPIARRLHGSKILLPGNHDSCWPGHRGHVAARQRYLDAGFETVIPVQNVLQVDDTWVNVDHFPYLGGGTAQTEPYDQRYAEHRLLDHGAWLVHGHVHDHWRIRGRQINVGVDAWAGRPVPVETVETYVRADQPAYEPPLPWTP